jgi:two-component system sensor histidine kinase/response regulator
MNVSLPNSSASRTRILVVDDITKNLQVVGTMLRNAGYEIMPTTSGAQALERVRVQPPDLILLDLMMPDMDGIEVCRRLKADPVTAQIPVIFLTASNEMEHLVKGFEVGAVDYVTKPFNPPELLARVRTHIELKLARQRLREMNDEKNEFMGVAAHDLRSPLNAVKGYAELMLDEPEMEPKERAELLGRIHDASRRMAEMVQNLLDHNRIERGEMKLNLTPIDLCALLSAVVEAQRPQATLKSQTIHLQDTGAAIQAMADRDVVIQVLENLVSNAVKYSPPGKNIFARAREEARAVRLEIQDQGPGLSSEDRRRLFGKYARLSARPTGGESSTGLGLSIVKKMVEAMNGKVWCESEPGKGATFIVALPGANTPEKPAPGPG